jgi:DNA-binding NtrC family response regulator
MNKDLKIALVDDESATLGMLSTILINMELTNVAKFTNGLDCLRYIKTEDEQVELIFLDINMDKVDGIEILQEIKKIDQGIKVIMLTAEATADNVKEAVTLGVDGFISKPFNQSKIQNALNKLSF